MICILIFVHICLAEEVEKKGKSIKEAEKADVHVVDEGFLEDVKKGGAALMISSHSIASLSEAQVKLLVWSFVRRPSVRPSVHTLPCGHTRGHSLHPIIMKLGQNV